MKESNYKKWHDSMIVESEPIDNKLSDYQHENIQGVVRTIQAIQGRVGGMSHWNYISEDKELELFSKLKELEKKLRQKIITDLNLVDSGIEGMNDYKYFFKSYNVYKDINQNNDYNSSLICLERFLNNVDVDKLIHIKSEKELEEEKTSKEIEKEIESAFDMDM